MALIESVADGEEILTEWGNSVVDKLNKQGRQPFAYAMGLSADAVSDAGITLTAVSGGLGGAIAVPVLVSGIMDIQSVQLRQGSTASARAAEFALYREPLNGGATLNRISGTDGTFSFTPSAIDDREAAISSPPTQIDPGIYWVVIRNTSGAQTFVIRRNTPAELAANSWFLSSTAASVAALGATIDLTGWAVSGAGVPFVRLEGRVAGRTAAL